MPAPDPARPIDLTHLDEAYKSATPPSTSDSRTEKPAKVDEL